MFASDAVAHRHIESRFISLTCDVRRLRQQIGLVVVLILFMNSLEKFGKKFEILSKYMFMHPVLHNNVRLVTNTAVLCYRRAA
jgi:hypothetical protein